MPSIRPVLGLAPLLLVACAPANAAAPEAATPSPHAAHAHEGHPHGAPGHSPDGAFHHDFSDADKWAKRFDDPARDAWQKPADVVRLLDVREGMTVADIGAGTGYFEPYLAKAVGTTGTVLALDVEQTLVDYMQQRMTREGLSQVRAAKIPFDSPELPDGKVDRILIVDTWHHIGFREAYSAKLAKALGPEGRLAIVDFTLEATDGPPREHRITPEKVIAELAEGGLVGEIAAEDLPQQYVVLARRR
jgi:predicted methyltransferase